MKDRPILFSAPMVRAILAGTKTQTRRIVRKQFTADASPAEVSATTAEGWQTSGHTGLWWDDGGAAFEDAVRCPYGMPGDRLWVRETFARIDGQTRPWIETDYAATYTDGDRLGDALGIKKRWTPSIHMPRHASRIDLEVTGVRVERLQDISEEDAIAEGIDRTPSLGKPGAFQWCDYRLPNNHAEWFNCPARSYQTLWEQINGHGTWKANPWVWVVEFRRISP